MNRSISTIVGLAVFGFAVVVLASPTVEERLPVGELVAWLGNDYVLVVPIAVLALAATIVVLVMRRRNGVSEATPPAVESVAPDGPGRELDAVLDSLPAHRFTPDHRRVRNRLRRVAIGTVARTERCSREAARERVDEGRWTADADVASFLAGDSFDPPSLAHRLSARVRRDDWFRLKVAAAVDELESVATDSASGTTASLDRPGAPAGDRS